MRFSGRNNQFSYSDDDFGNDYGSDSYSYGGPYYDPRARDMYYNPSYASININLWVFIDGAHFEQTTMPITISVPTIPGTPLTNER